MSLLPSYLLPSIKIHKDRVSAPRIKEMLLYWGIFTLGFYIGIIFFLSIFSSKEE